MKKKNTKVMRFSAVLASALMASAAAGMTVSANTQVETVPSAKPVKSASKSTRIRKSDSTPTISLEGNEAKPGDLVEVPMIINSDNQCVCYDLLIEYDARLELEGVVGVNATCEFEEGGRKFVSLVGFSVDPYEDGSEAAVLKFRVPKDAENDNYEVKFSQIKGFADNDADFPDYEYNNTVIKVSGGVEKKQTSLELKNVAGLAGGNAVVQVVPTTGNRCSSYNMLVEYDSRLLLEDRDVAGANSFCIFEEDGRSYVSLVGYTADIYSDGQAMAALNFHIPADAVANETFEVKIAKVETFATAYEEFEKFSTADATITVAAPGSDKQYKVFQKFAPNGALMGSAVGFRGDANGDGKTNVRDAAAIANVLASRQEFDEWGNFFGDVDDNGQVNVRDAAKIAKFVCLGSVKWD